MKNKSSFLLTIVILLLPAMGFSRGPAQEAKAPEAKAKPAVKGKPQTMHLSFEDELIRGGAPMPEAFFIVQDGERKEKKLIRLRDNFNYRLLQHRGDFGTAGE